MAYSYEFKTPPFKHQLDTFEASKDEEAYGIFWEQGTGKSKEMVDQASYLYETGKIDAVFILAPNNVHRNWIVDEVPTHCPDRVLRVSRLFFYQTKKANTIPHKKACKEILAHQGLSWLAMSYDAFMTKPGKQLAWNYLKGRKVLYITDEASRIKNVSSKRSRSVVASAKYALYRRLLTGTPVANGAFDVYPLMKFLQESFWVQYGLSSFFSFKNKFGVFEKGYNGQTKKEFEVLVAYKNLEQLYRILKTKTSRVTKDDVLDLPPKLYSKRYFEMTDMQTKAYEELKEMYMTFVDGDLVTAPLAIVRLLRLQQITCGYVPSDDREITVTEDDEGNFHTIESQKFHLLGNHNPRLELLGEICNDLSHKAIIWARFTKDIDQIMDMLGSRAVRYDGQVKDAERAEAIARFQGKRPIMENGTRIGWEEIPPEQQADYFVANADAAGEGLTLHAARTVIYYNNSFKLIGRLQSEDRAHRIGQEHPVNYIDIVAPGTVDEHITNALRNKLNIANQITGDKYKGWI